MLLGEANSKSSFLLSVELFVQLMRKEDDTISKRMKP